MNLLLCTRSSLRKVLGTGVNPGFSMNALLLALLKTGGRRLGVRCSRVIRQNKRMKGVAGV